MKTLKVLFCALALSVFAISCSSDDDDSTKVKYQIVGIDNAVTQIQYKKGNGSMETLTDYTDFAGSGDATTVSVSNFPFTADLKVTVNNTTNAVKTYSLAIYVDGEVEDMTPFSVPAMSTATGEVDFLIANE
ncbi:MAG: hypothetical protein QM710_06805 [Flavobacterium sp.]